MSRKRAFPSTTQVATSHFAVIIDDLVVGLVEDGSARTATLMATRDISFERVDGPIAADEEAAIARMNAERAKVGVRRPALQLIRGGRLN
jgi:hypothetical protein